MKFISRHTDYAIRALIYMAKRHNQNKEGLVTVDDIVRDLNLPKKFTRRILQKLAQAKILNSYKGKDGGFSFLVAPDKIRLPRILKIFQGEIDITNCLLKGKVCPNKKKCKLREKLKAINLLVVRELDKITITSL